MAAHWGQAEANPVSPVYGGPMVDMGNAYAWAWDARPYPIFPNSEPPLQMRFIILMDRVPVYHD